MEKLFVTNFHIKDRLLYDLITTKYNQEIGVEFLILEEATYYDKVTILEDHHSLYIYGSEKTLRRFRVFFKNTNKRKILAEHEKGKSFKR